MTQFLVLAGCHAEGGRVYRKGETVDSKYDLNKQNSRGAQKFQMLGGSPEQVAIQTAAAVAAGVDTPTPVPVPVPVPALAPTPVPPPATKPMSDVDKVSPSGQLANVSTSINNDDGLKDMTKDELLKFAAEEEIAVPPNSNKSQIIETIRGVFQTT